jgi:hypothetical protein
MGTIVSAWRWTFYELGIPLDHTYVGQGPGSGNNNPPADYFGCWAEGFYETQYPTAPVVTGEINYNCANCYRDTIGPYHDTAGIGIYGINGVCHQSANCFLFSAGVTLNFSVIGYWASLLAYGPWGTGFISNPPYWLATVFGICSLFNPAAVAKTAQPAAAEPTLFDQLRDYYTSLPQNPDPHDVIINEAAISVRSYVPGFNPEIYQDLHADFLSQKDAAIATGITGQGLADQLNDLSKQLQLAVADRVGPEVYKTLNGVDAGHTAYLCDPRIAAAVGVPVPLFKRG